MDEKIQNGDDGVSGDPVERLAATRHEFGEHGGVNMSIAASTTFTVLEAGTMPEIFQGRLGPDEGGCFLYGRHFNPTVHVLGRQLAAMEGAVAGYCSASGLGAISSALMGCLDQGDHVVASDTLSGGTWAMLAEFFLEKCGITTTFVDMTDHDAVRAAFTDRTRVLYTESLTNPTLRVPDLPALSKIAHEHGAKVMVDNTFALGHHAHRAWCRRRRAFADQVHQRRQRLHRRGDRRDRGIHLLADGSAYGSADDPRADDGPTGLHSISLRLPHLHIRMIEHARRAQIFAERLQQLSLDVSYPGLPGHPDHELFRRIGRSEYGFGGLLTLDVGSREVAEDLMEDLQNIEGFGFMAVSLGYFDTLMSCSASSTSSEMDDESLAAAGISPGLVRMSIGITGSVEQRWGQFERSLRRSGLVRS